MIATPDRRTALRAGLAVLGTAAASAGPAACADGGGSRSRPARNQPSPSPAALGTRAGAGPAASAPAGTGGKAGAAGPAGPVGPVGSLGSLGSLGDTAEVDHATSGRPQVALTFHGDGTPELAESLLREAEANGARLTVLAVGRWLGEHPELARRVLDGGHELGNHTENHVDITRLAPDAAFAEIQACAARLTKLTGSPGLWFRPSQTRHAAPPLVAQARRAGYRTVLSYDVDPLDYQDPPSATIADRLLRAVRPGAVVSLHLGHRDTVDALPAVLAGLKSRGLAAVTASELFS